MGFISTVSYTHLIWLYKVKFAIPDENYTTKGDSIEFTTPEIVGQFIKLSLIHIYIAMTKNHAAIIKQLCDLVPPEKKKESRLQALRDE